METPATYDKVWIADFFHDFPHIDASFEIVNSTFDPKNERYQQALGFWALVPVVLCVLLWIVFLIYFILRCCQQHTSSKEHSSVLKIVTVVLILLGGALLGYGFYENEQAHDGVNDLRNEMHDFSEIMTSSSQTVEMLKHLAADVSENLSPTLKSALIFIPDSDIRTMVENLINEIQEEASEAREYLNKVKVTTTTKSDTLDNFFNSFEYYRWMITIVIFCLYIFIFLLLLIGVVLRSKYLLIISATVAIICSLFIWAATGFYLSFSVAAGDLCSDPDGYFISISEGSSYEVRVAVEAYIKCTDPSKPYAEAIEGAMVKVFNSSVAFNKTAQLLQPYSITEVDRVMFEMNNDLHFCIGNLSLILQSIGRCTTIHNHYTSGVNSMCTVINIAFAFLSLICCVLGVLCTILIFVASCEWRRYTKQRQQSQYVTVDDKDPFLPRPPPYETDYGTMGQSSPRPVSERGSSPRHVSERGSSQHANNEEQVMTLMYQHPFPTDDSPPPAYHPGLFMPRHAEPGPTTSFQRPYNVK